MAKTCSVCGAPLGMFEKHKPLFQQDPKVNSLTLCLGCSKTLNGLGIGKIHSSKWSFLRSYLGELNGWKIKFPESTNPPITNRISQAEGFLPKIRDPYVRSLYEERIHWLKELLALDDYLVNLFEGELKSIYLKPLYDICNVFKTSEDKVYQMALLGGNLYYSTFTPLESMIDIEWQRARQKFFDQIYDHNNPNLDMEAESNQIIQGIRSGKIVPGRYWEEGVGKSSELIPYKLTKIPVENIIYFSKDGTLEHVSVVSGGGASGGGANLGGAIAGGILFGGVGAIIGSRMHTEIKIDPIKTEIIKKDSRKAYLLFKDENGDLVQQSFSYEYYNFFMKHFPHKEFSKVQGNMDTTTPAVEEKKANPASSNIEEIKKYKELLDMGIITQAEFDLKKKELLGL